MLLRLLLAEFQFLRVTLFKGKLQLNFIECWCAFSFRLGSFGIVLGLFEFRWKNCESYGCVYWCWSSFVV